MKVNPDKINHRAKDNRVDILFDPGHRFYLQNKDTRIWVLQRIFLNENKISQHQEGKHKREQTKQEHKLAYIRAWENKQGEKYNTQNKK